MDSDKMGWVRVLLLIMPYLLVTGIAQLGGAYLLGMAMEPENQSLFQQLILRIFDLLGLLGLLVIFMRFVDHRSFIELGFAVRGRQKELVVGIVIGSLIMGCAYIFLVLTHQIVFERFIFRLEDTILSIVFFAIVAVVEEVLLRGYVLRNFMLSFNKYVALLLSAGLFALLHAYNPNLEDVGMINLFLAGILLGVSYLYTKNLWFPIGLHFSWNLFQTYVGFNVSGGDFYSIIEFELPEANLLNGGAFGFEGSLLATGIQLVVIGGTIRYYVGKELQSTAIEK